MKFDTNNIELLDKLIENFNNILISDINNDKSKIEFLYEYVDKEDLPKLLKVLSKLKKNNIYLIEKAMCINNRKRINSINTNVDNYSFEEILDIFNNLDDEKIIKEYKLQDLIVMYYKIYYEKPSSNKTKQDIITVIRNYIYTSNRAKAFNLIDEDKN